jgi:hypothetical protein
VAFGWDDLLAPVASIINKLIPDKAAAAAATAQLNELIAQGKMQEELAQLQAVTTAQSDVNKVEAASAATFVAGWRPFIGWVCGSALALAYIIGPLFTWIAALIGHPTPFPTFDIGTLMPLMFGMLGMGTLRTYEKVKGVSATH